MAYFGISLKNNEEQQEFARLINANDIPIVICTGNAGTGKTFVSLAIALQLKQEKKYANIYYIRDNIAVGHEIGSLPGTAEDKMAPYWGPVYDSLESICQINNGQYNVKDLASRIKVLPLAFLRGRSFCNSIIIVDEAESYDLNALKTVLSRADRWSKIILLGSHNQIDDWRQRRKKETDFQKVIEKLSSCQYVGYIELKQSMRAPWTAEIDALLSEIEEFE